MDTCSTLGGEFHAHELRIVTPLIVTSFELQSEALCPRLLLR